MSLPLLLVALLNLQPVSASLKGISLHFQGADQYGTPQSNQKIRDLQNSTGLNLVAVRQYVSLNRYDDPQLEELILPNLKNFKDHLDFLEQHSLKTAFTLGLYLKSASALPFSLRDFSLWHGTVDFDEPAKFDVFFKKYTSILQKYLRLTMLEGDLEIFTLANELNSLTTTKALDTPVRQKKFLDSLKFALNSSDADERAYIKNKIEYLLKFKLKTAPTLQARLMLDSQTNLVSLR